MNKNNVDFSLVQHLRHNKLQPAILKFEQTGDDSELLNQVDFCIKKISVAVDTDTEATIKKLISSLEFDSDLTKDKNGLLKAVEILKAKSPN